MLVVASTSSVVATPSNRFNAGNGVTDAGLNGRRSRFQLVKMTEDTRDS